LTQRYSTEHKVSWHELAPSLQEMFKALQSQIASIYSDLDKEKKERENGIRNLYQTLREIKGKLPATDYDHGLDGQVKRLDADNNKTFWSDYIFFTTTPITNCEGEVPERSLVYNPVSHKLYWFMKNDSNYEITINPSAAAAPIIKTEDTQNIEYAVRTPIYTTSTKTTYKTAYDILTLNQVFYRCYNSSNNPLKTFTSTVYLPLEFKGVHPDSTLVAQMNQYIQDYKDEYYDADFHLHFPHIPVRS